jgi:signal recognition particle receptor subunit beta
MQQLLMSLGTYSFSCEVASAKVLSLSFLRTCFYWLAVIRVAFRHKVSNTILLVGLSDAGKTTLFYQLRDGSAHQGSVTSMEPNDDEFILHSESTKKVKIKPVHIVDVPGHARLRPKLDDFLPKTCGLVFVVDALDFMPNLRSAAEYILSSSFLPYCL